MKRKILIIVLAIIVFCMTGCEFTIPARDTTSRQESANNRQEETEKTLSFFGEPITLEEAQRVSGLYMREGDKFILIKPQWTQSSYGFNSFSFSSQVAMCPFSGSGSVSSRMPILYNADFEIPQIPNNAQFVLIGITNIVIYETLHEGWTIPIALSLGTPGGPNPGGWIKTNTSSEILNFSGDRNQAFEELNGRNPTDFVDNMLYTGFHFLLCSYHGILTATYSEEFTFSWWQGTDWIERTYTADRRFITLPTSNSRNPAGADFEIIETRNGYFEVKFLTPPLGYYGIGTSISRLDRIVEFVNPSPNDMSQKVEFGDYEGGLLHIDEVETLLIRQGFPRSNIDIRREENATVPAGYVIRTEPRAHTMVGLDEHVTVWVSFGGSSEGTQVPDVLGLTRTQAEEKAKMHDIVLVFIEEYSDTVDVDRIIRQEPLPMTPVDKFSTVEVVISIGLTPPGAFEISHSVARDNITGNYIFEYYIDGIRQDRLTKQQDVELNKTINWLIEGADISEYAIYITSELTGNRALFCRYEVDFTGDEITHRLIEFNDRIFSEIDSATVIATPVTNPPTPPQVNTELYRIPDFTTRRFDSLEGNNIYSFLKFNPVYEFNDQYKEGIVFEQNIPPDSVVAAGSEIILKVSKGSATVP